MQCAVDPDDVLSNDLVDMVSAFLVANHKGELEAILGDLNTSISRHHSVVVSCLDLMQHNLIIATLLLHHPDRLQVHFDMAVRAAQKLIKEAEESKPDVDQFILSDWTIKESCHLRLHRLPKCPELCKPTVTSIRAADINRLLSVSGTIIRTGTMKMIHQRRQCAPTCPYAHMHTLHSDGRWWDAALT